MSRMRWLQPNSPPGFDKRHKSRSGGILREGGTKREKAATSPHDDILLDSEECYE